MFEIIILMLAGLGAGVVTGLAGASAVIIAAPLLIVFLDYPTYMAIGIALSIDVFASLVATYIYRKKSRFRIKESLILLISGLITAIIGSYFSIKLPSEQLGMATGLGVLVVGFSLMLKSRRKLLTTKQVSFQKKYKIILLVVVGLVIGAIAGFFGGGGGMSILFALVFILGYKTHEAIGTSVFMMIFIALFGGVAHYINMEFSITALLIGAVSGIVGAYIASQYANSLNEKSLNKLVGIVIMILGVLLVLKNIIY